LPVDHYENFPVASWLLPAAARPPIEAIYGFARGDVFRPRPMLNKRDRTSGV
jgi:hypothetical protein